MPSRNGLTFTKRTTLKLNHPFLDGLTWFNWVQFRGSKDRCQRATFEARKGPDRFLGQDGGRHH